MWLDSRAENEAQALRSVLDNETFYKTTGLPEVTGALPLAKLLWLRKHEPDTFVRAHKLLLLEDYLLHWLTGRFVSEKSLQTSTGWFDLHSDGLWHSGLAAAGASAELLPELLECGAPAGSLLPGPAAELGLPPNIPVVAGAMDQTAAALAAGCTRPGTVTETTGTALVMAACTDAPMFRSGHHVTVYRHALPGKYLYLPIGNTAGMALRWFRDDSAATFPQEQRDMQRWTRWCKASPAGATGWRSCPFLSGRRGSRRLSRSPAPYSSARGFPTTRAHFARSVMESVAFLLRDFFGMLNALGCPADTVYSLGGGARSAVWQQIKADACGRTFRVPACSEATAMGAAFWPGGAADSSPPAFSLAAVKAPSIFQTTPARPLMTRHTACTKALCRRQTAVQRVLKGLP